MAGDQYADLLTQSRLQDLERRMLGVEKHVYYPKLTEAEIKSQAAQAQATEHLPIKSDVRAVVELAAFVRKIADGKYYCNSLGVQVEARAILKGLSE